MISSKISLSEMESLCAQVIEAARKSPGKHVVTYVDQIKGEGFYTNSEQRYAIRDVLRWQLTESNLENVLGGELVICPQRTPALTKDQVYAYAKELVAYAKAHNCDVDDAAEILSKGSLHHQVKNRTRGYIRLICAELQCTELQ